ncbi:MAG: hypothetical protein ABI051_13520 [Vicinamibacterales bacterium]
MDAAGRWSCASEDSGWSRSAAERTAAEAKRIDTVAALAAEYLEKHAGLRKKTGAEDARILRVDVLPHLGERSLRDLTRREIRTVLDRIHARGAPYATNHTLEIIRKMRWQDLDLKAGWWTIPREHSKNGRPHRVPLVTEAIEIIETQAPAQDEEQDDERSPCMFSVAARTPSLRPGSRRRAPHSHARFGSSSADTICGGPQPREWLQPASRAITSAVC